MKKKLIMFLMSLAVLIGGLGFGGIQPAESAIKGAPSGGTGNSGWKKSCKPTNIGQKCTEYIDYYISHTWSKSQVKTIHKRLDKLGNPKWMAVMDIISAVSKHPIPITITMANYGASHISDKFAKAYYQNKSITLKYTYRMTKTSSRGTVKNMKWIYNK